jgi:nitrite reductase/ring-hydroxylating ferredoxin subunit
MTENQIRWFKVCRIADLKPGQARSITILAKPYAVFNVNGTLHGLEASCRHMKANLAAGRLYGDIVECAMHGWEYNVVTGECLTVPDDPLQKYPVKVENNDIWIGIDFDKMVSEAS